MRGSRSFASCARRIGCSPEGKAVEIDHNEAAGDCADEAVVSRA